MFVNFYRISVNFGRKLKFKKLKTYYCSNKTVQPYFSKMLHTFNDGSVLRTMTAKELVKIPVWHGQRTLDKAHAAKIRDAVGAAVDRLDSGYRIVFYLEPDTSGHMVRQSYLIDGQHRAEVLREHFLSSLCEPDFTVVVTEKEVDSETDAIEYFNAINNVKPQQWRTDPNILVNTYVIELEKVFNAKKPGFIRTSATVRPYLGADKLREALKAIVASLRSDKASIESFARRAVEKNKEMLDRWSVNSLGDAKNASYYDKAAKVGFMLAVDPKLPWVRELVR